MDATPVHEQATALRYIAPTVLVLHPVIKDERLLDGTIIDQHPARWV